MKIIKNRSFKPLAAIFAAFIATIKPAFCQDGPPPPPPDPYLDSYAFWDTTNWTSDDGYPPIRALPQMM
jgi:hypothetical protein